MDMPGGRVHGNSHDVGAPGPDHFEVMFVPLAIALQLVRIARIQSPEDDGLAVGGYKMIALHADVGGSGQSPDRKQNGSNAETKGFFHNDDSRIEAELGRFTNRSVSQCESESTLPNHRARVWTRLNEAL